MNEIYKDPNFYPPSRKIMKRQHLLAMEETMNKITTKNSSLEEMEDAMAMSLTLAEEYLIISRNLGNAIAELKANQKFQGK